MPDSLVVDRGVGGVGTALSAGFQSLCVAQDAPVGTELAEAGGHGLIVAVVAVGDAGVGVVVVVEAGRTSVGDDAVGGAGDAGQALAGTAFAGEGDSLGDKLAIGTGSGALGCSDHFVVVDSTVETGLAVGDEGTSTGGATRSTG